MTLSDWVCKQSTLAAQSDSFEEAHLRVLACHFWQGWGRVLQGV